MSQAELCAFYHQTLQAKKCRGSSQPMLCDALSAAWEISTNATTPFLLYVHAKEGAKWIISFKTKSGQIKWAEKSNWG